MSWVVSGAIVAPASLKLIGGGAGADRDGGFRGHCCPGLIEAGGIRGDISGSPMFPGPLLPRPH